MANQENKTCETCVHYVKFNDNTYGCNYPMSIYLTCLESDNRHFYINKDVAKSILPSDTK